MNKWQRGVLIGGAATLAIAVPSMLSESLSPFVVIVGAVLVLVTTGILFFATK